MNHLGLPPGCLHRSFIFRLFKNIKSFLINRLLLNPDMDPHTLRDCLSVTGVDSPGKSIAAGPNGQLIFKKSASQLYYCDVHEMSSYTLCLSRMDPLYQDCQVK
ncbi:unnamed protein product [Haemonchus placei]|uniref:CPSF_A domain-containing protein n=1 Tax=Haemonchus placei TaxID=6290 RepID=A0A0N4VXX9_HAEPC|nr:unnamed protein product [Haemonchus placei]